MKTKYPSFFGVLAALLLVVSFVLPTSMVTSTAEADPGICKWDNLSEPGAGFGLYNIWPNEILSWDIASDGTTMAAVVKMVHPQTGSVLNFLLKSPAYTGLFWTSGVMSAINRETTMFSFPILSGIIGANVPRTIYEVVISPDNPNFWAVTVDGYRDFGDPLGPGEGVLGTDWRGGPREVYVTQNGGADWELANLQPTALADGFDASIRSFDISVDYGGKRDLAVGLAMAGAGTVYVVKSTGFAGWLQQIGMPIADYFAIAFSPSYASDASLAAVYADATGTYYNVALRDLDNNTTNQMAFTPGLEVVDPSQMMSGFSPTWAELNKADIELPSDFSGQAASLRRAYISLDTYECGLAKPAWDGIIRFDNQTGYMLMDTSTIPDKSIYSIAYFGTYASGKLLAGDRIGYPCEAIVPTYFTDSPTVCGTPCWYECLKCPTGAACGAGECNCPGLNDCAPGSKTGVGAALVMWRPNGQLAFAATGSLAADNGTHVALPVNTTMWWFCWANGAITPCDESAFSISRNNGETWNQVSLIDTEITRFTDIAPSADCKTIYLASVNDGCGVGSACYASVEVTCDNTAVPTTCTIADTATGALCACGTDPVVTIWDSDCWYDEDACACAYEVEYTFDFRCVCDDGCSASCDGLATGYVDCGITENITISCACDCSNCCEAPAEPCCAFDSVWRTSSNVDVVSPLAALPVGTVWERVFTHVTALDCLDEQSDVALLRTVGWCADPTSEIVGWAAWNTLAAAWSPDYGDYWAMITVRNPVQDFVFESRTMLYFLSPDGLVQKMPFTGTAWSTALPNYDASINPAHTIAAMPDGKVIVGRGMGAPYATSVCLNMDSDNPSFTVQLSSGPLTSGGAVHVAFDPAFDDNTIYYIAVEGVGGSVYRNNPTAQLRWSDTDMMADSSGAIGCFTYPYAGLTGIVLGFTGGALYASSGDDVDNEGYGGVYRTIDDGTGQYGPLSGIPKPGIAWDQLFIGLLDDVYFGAQPSALRSCGCCTEETDTTLYAIDYRDYDTPTFYEPLASQGKIWGFTDCLAKRAPSLITEDNVLIGCDPVSGRAGEVNLCWEQLCVSGAYDIEISKNPDFSILVLDLVAEDACTGLYAPARVTEPCAYIPAGGQAFNDPSAIAWAEWGTLECGHVYYWRLKARSCATDQIIRSPWSEVRSFSVKAGLPIVASFQGLQLLSPANGMIGLPVKGASFSWAPMAGEDTKYKFILAKDGAMTQIVKEAEVTGTAYSYDGTLDYSTPYFWKVQCIEPSCDASPTFSFMTEAAPPPPDEEEKAPPTPLWVWVVIAIGALLVIVTLVLIFKTRRV